MFLTIIGTGLIGIYYPSKADRVICDELRVNDIRDESRPHKVHGCAETILSFVY